MIGHFGAFISGHFGVTKSGTIPESKSKTDRAKMCLVPVRAQRIVSRIVSFLIQISVQKKVDFGRTHERRKRLSKRVDTSQARDRQAAANQMYALGGGELFY